MNFLYNEPLFINMIKMESFSSICVSERIKTKTYKNIILPIVSYVCETWSLTLREKHRLRVFKNRVLRRFSGLRGMRKQGSQEDYIMKGFLICTPHQYYLGDQTMKK